VVHSDLKDHVAFRCKGQAETTHQTAQHHIPEDLNHQEHMYMHNGVLVRGNEGKRCMLSSGLFTGVCNLSANVFGTPCLFHLHEQISMKYDRLRMWCIYTGKVSARKVA
jgi:hypothetical protein